MTDFKFNLPKHNKEALKAKEKLKAIEEQKAERENKYSSVNLKLLQEGRTADPLVQGVINRVAKRSNGGLLKFQVSMDEAKKPLDAWIQDTQEELLDAVLYLEKVRKELKHVKKILKSVNP